MRIMECKEEYVKKICFRVSLVLVITGTVAHYKPIKMSLA